MAEIDWFKMAYTFLGGLGIFFFGMKILSEALQAMTGTLIRKIINALTTKRLMAVLVGAGVTTLVQSSSVTTVMVIGFVEAGLMELSQAIGVIFGANIGTTITGWIIAIKVGKYGLLLVGLGVFPMLFAKRKIPKHIGGTLLALGFVFMGLKFMSASFKPLRSAPAFLDMLQYFSADTYLSVFACVLVGMVLTFVIQSSSAMLGITIALASTGAISFQTAVALVLGENIGTTITAILASIGTGSIAKRAARAHAVFNIIGVLWVGAIFWIFLDLVDGVILGDPDALGADGGKPYIAAHIAAAHTIFNVANTLLFIPFRSHLATLVTWMTPAPEKKETPHLRYLPGTVWSSPSMALTAAEKELQHLARIVVKLMHQTRVFLLADAADEEEFEEIRKRESITDSIQVEITLFLCKVQENRLTRQQSADAYAFIRAADELESIADYFEALAKYRRHFEEKGQGFSEVAQTQLREFFDQVADFFLNIHETMKEQGSHDLRKIAQESDILTASANKIRSSHRKRIESGQCSAVSAMFFSDMIVALRKVRGHAVNLAEAMNHTDVSDLT